MTRMMLSYRGDCGAKYSAEHEASIIMLSFVILISTNIVFSSRESHLKLTPLVLANTE